MGISIGALQRLVALGGVPLSALPDVMDTLSSVAGQAVDIQLKILQTLLSILTYCKGMHGDTLGTALLLCFKLQDSRVNVVSSTAAATLRQAIMVVFDRIADSGSSEEPSVDLTLSATSEDAEPETIKITPGAFDGYCILLDLCILTAGSQSSSSLSLWSASEKTKPRMLKLSYLQRSFGLELIESIMSGYETVVKTHPELLDILRHSLHPLILRLQSEKPSFPVALRINRLIYVLIRSYAHELPSEVETYLLSLIRMGAGDEEDKKDHRKDSAPWVHVLALEIIRGICGDPALLRAIWAQYDEQGGPKLFQKIVASLGRLVNEKPALLGVGAQMHGLGVPASSTENVHAGYFDMGFGMVATAASVGVSAVSAALGSGGGLGSHSTMKQRLIEQHDKAEAPAVPETYIYLLAVQSLDAISESIYSAVGNDATQDAARGMADCAWPALLAGLSYCIGTNLSDSLFAEVLTALQDFTIACGILGLSTPRDAFLTTLARYAVPPSVVSAMQTYLDSPAGPKTTGGVINADSLGLTALTGSNTGPPSLSERNLACLRSLIAVARLLAGIIGPAWHDVLETLQNANYLLASSSRVPQTKRNVSGLPPVPSSPSLGRDSGEFTAPRPELLQDLDTDSIKSAMNSFFDSSAELDDKAFTVFITALCRLSAEMIGMETVVDLTHSPTTALSPTLDKSAGRRTSGINVSHSIKTGERSFGLSKLRTVSVLNLERLVGQDPSVGWTVVTQHLLEVARHVSAASVIRLQASETLSELLMSAMRTSQEPRVQHQVFDVLVRQVDVAPVSNTPSTDYDVRSAGFGTLNNVLETFGHSLEVGWPTIFGMLNSVCKQPEERSAPTSTHRGDANLVRIAFPSLTLICTDFLSSLDPDSMRQCISCLGYFGRQHDDVNITLAAINLLWTVSDAVQGDSKDLWLYLLTELLELARDARLEVRSSAMQTLFRCIELYGSSLSPELWEDVLWKVVFPLLETMRADESQVLALTSVGSVFGTLSDQIAALPSSPKVYQTLFDRLKQSFLSEPRNCSTAALKVMERVLVASKAKATSLEPTWETFCGMGEGLDEGEPYTQENLVALVRVASLLCDRLEWTDDKARKLSTILRSAIEYSRSPDYRPDVDSMSPLQQAVTDLIIKASKSDNFSASLVLADLTEFASLAYLGDSGGKVSYVALSKYCMPAMAAVFTRVADTAAVYEDGMVDSMLGAYALPIKLKYDCPPSNKFGSDPPLWRTAMTTFARVLDLIMPTLEKKGAELPKERLEAVWEQIMGVYAGILLAEDGNSGEDDEGFVLTILAKITQALTPRLGDERVPARVIESHAETLAKASQLCHYDFSTKGGTTAPVVPEAQEEMRYWAFDQLVANAGGQGNPRVAALFIPAVLKRFHSTLRHFLDDVKLRGQMPFTRVREDELLYVLRHLVTMTLTEGTTAAVGGTALAQAAAASPRAHLFKYYSLLLELAFVPAHLPSMWVLPSEHVLLFTNDEETCDEAVNTGDGAELIEVSARDLARRCLELVGVELGLTPSHS